MIATRSLGIIHMRALLALYAIVLPLVAAQVLIYGKCPAVNVVQDFNVSAYLGKWYEQKRYPSFVESGRCVIAVYKAIDDNTVAVNNSQVNLLTNKASYIEGTATLTGNSGEAKLAVNFPSAGSVEAPYWVLDTDYDSYAIVWSCFDVFGLAGAKNCWVLTRDKNPSQDVMSNVNESLQTRGVDQTLFLQTQQVCGDN